MKRVFFFTLIICTYGFFSLCRAELPSSIDSVTQKETITFESGATREIRTFIQSKERGAETVDTTIYRELNQPALYVDTVPFKIANRSHCALDSNNPTQSVTAFVDSYALGQLASRMASAINQEQRVFINQAIERFRYTAVTTIKMIADRLLAGRLPLLPREGKGNVHGDLYLKLSNDCAKTGRCKALDAYLSDLWLVGQASPSVRISLEEWQLLDNFNKESFLRKSLRELSPHLSCLYLKKFAPWKSDLLKRIKISEKDNLSDEKLIRSIKERDQYQGSCNEVAAIDGLKAASFQFDVMDIDEGYWRDVGFDFWYSLKVYLSYALRNASEVSEMAFPVAYLVNSLNIEESIYLISNDCSSITPPTCSGDYLARESMRYLTEKNSEEGDLFKEYSDGAAEVLLDKNKNSESDPLNYMKNPEYKKWGENLNSGLQRVRIFFKKRLSTAIRKSKLILSGTTPSQISDTIRNLFKTTPESDNKRNSYFHLCSEFYLAGHPTYSFIGPNLAKYRDYTELDPLLNHLGSMKFSEIYRYYREVSESVIQFCDELESADYWKVASYSVPTDNYRDWYSEISNHKGGVMIADKALSLKPYLAFKNYQRDPSIKNIICVDAVSCARDLLEAVIALYSTIHYRDYVATSLRETRSLNANVVGLESACGMYDPWWRTSKAFFDLGVDVVTGITSMFIPTPLYLDMTLAPKSVTSINELLESGQLKYSPQYDKSSILASFGIDFGPLVGAPCVLSLTNTNGPMFDTLSGNYLFTGLKLMACSGEDKQSVAVYTPSSIATTEDHNWSGCFSCQLNFESVANEVSFLTNIPLVGGLYHLIKGVVRFVENMVDPENIPRSFDLDINLLFEKYRVGHGLSSTSKELYDYFTKKKGDSVWGYSEKGSQIFVYTSQCHKPLYLSTYDLNDAYNRNSELKILDGGDSCQWGKP